LDIVLPNKTNFALVYYFLSEFLKEQIVYIIPKFLDGIKPRGNTYRGKIHNLVFNLLWSRTLVTYE
jgi:hypothetical protein